MDPFDNTPVPERLLRGTTSAATSDPAAPARPGIDGVASAHEQRLCAVELETQNTALRAAQIALQQSHDRYADLFDCAPTAYLVLSHDGIIDTINRAAATLLGAPRETVLHTPLAHYLSAADAERWNSYWLGALARTDGLACELALKRGDGPTIPVRLDRIGSVTEGKIPSLRIVMTDITERREVESALRQSETLLHEMIENLDQAFFKAATDYSRFYFISPAADRIWGRPRSRLMENPYAWLDWLHPDDKAWVVQLIVSSQHSDSYFAEFRIVRPDGEIRWLHSHAFALGHPATGGYVIGYQSDITERKRIEAELTSAKQAAENASLSKTRFLAAASHDLRQPIQAINLFNDALGRTKLSVEQQSICAYLSQSVHSLSDLLNALLDISRLDAGAVKAFPEVIQVADLFSRIDGDFLPMAPDKSLRFKFFFPLEPMAVVADLTLLMSLLGNLIGNALKYTKCGGVLVAIRRRRDHALVQVWDTGIGIAPEHVDVIFDDYFQVDNAARDKTKGLGLGLAIARRVAKLLATEVICRSDPGKGSVFSFCLPLADTSIKGRPAQHETSRLDAHTAATFAGQHVVVVEDDPVVAEAMKFSFESLGMTVSAFGTAEDALADSRIADADIYVSDFRLPGINGLEFLDAVQKRSTQPIRGVVLTGDTSPERIALTQSSSWTVLFKPVHLPRLLAAIEALEPPP